MELQQREQTFKESVFRMISFSADIIQSFFEYWSEPNKSGTKMRFELEKTWDLNRRMRRWQTMGDTRKDFKPTEKVNNKVFEMQSTIKEVNQLDTFLQKYISRPGDIPFEEFGKFYEYMKAEKLLTISPEKGKELMDIYKNDKTKCRCAAVQITLDGYVKGGITVAKIFDLRLKVSGPTA